MERMLPRLYAIVDAELVKERQLDLIEVANAYRSAGILLLQYRDKIHTAGQILQNAQRIRQVFAGSGCTLVLNDWPDLTVKAEWDGVHIGQGDMEVDEARRIVGTPRWVGVSTHNEEQMRAAQLSSADYVAVGPVFDTLTKANAEKVIGLDGVKLARRVISKPLVAIGGITRRNARGVIDAGADAVAVISDLLSDSDGIEKTAEKFLEELC